MTPLSTLRRIIEAKLGGTMRDADLAAFLDGLIRPDGVELAQWLFLNTPPPAFGPLLAEAWRRRVSREVWATLLFPIWIHASRHVIDAAVSRGNLRSWFRKAEFWRKPRLDVLPGLDRATLPAEHITVWRGGSGEAATLAGGYSWTLRREVAAKFCMGHRPETRLLVCRTVSRREIGFYWPHPMQEVVLTEAGPYEVVGGPKEIAGWAVGEEQMRRETTAWLRSLAPDAAQFERELEEYRRWRGDHKAFGQQLRAGAHPMSQEPRLVTFGELTTL